jgi:multiple sugar transport system ATP-binding protein
VEWIEHLGDQNHLHVKIGSHKITTLTSPATSLEPGDQVAIELEKPLYFDANGNRIFR